ncbi:MAG: DUF6580 family putative transport protein [Chthoniobacterales bacterium]
MIPAFLLVFVAVVYRIATGILVQSGAATWLSNFAPLAAIALCGAVYFPAKYKFTVPVLALLVSDIVLDSYYGARLFDAQMIGRYLALIAVGAMGLLLVRRASLKTMLPATVAGSAIFYFISNTFSWLSDPGYVKNLAGLFQALTVGLPGYAPTWTFFRNSLVSDLVFTGLFVLAVQYGRSTERARTTSALSRVA